ncbi:unnamed protein product [Rhizophagus irregularis]|uniref:Uncharacterized protein n=1 Tax=Rhizophagus irregularis TaxID=588596 RepID=A0A2I1HHH9_9GLOM|nr:hypothetical protein RhiirA4_480158 [Rhizophagus irregularis]CAB4442047.1 unnamed protein product [Rhizophagus irregularis]
MNQIFRQFKEIQKDNKTLREEFTSCRNKQQTKQQQQYKSILKNDNQKLKEKAATSLNNNNKRVHIEDSGSSSDSGMDEFEVKLSKSDEKIEQNMTLLTNIAKKLDSLSSKITSSSNTTGLEDGDNAITED